MTKTKKNYQNKIRKKLNSMLNTYYKKTKNKNKPNFECKFDFYRLNILKYYLNM